MDREKLLRIFPYSDKDPLDLPVIKRFSQEITRRTPQVVSGLLWGSIAGGGFDPDRSDLDIMLVLERIPDTTGKIRLQKFRDTASTIGEIETDIISDGLAKPHFFSSR